MVCRDKYGLSEVCQKLQLFSVVGGHYQIGCIEPHIFFFVFEKSATSAASKASRTFVCKECQVVRMDEI